MKHNLQRHWFSGLILVSVLLHVVGLFVLQPWAETRMEFDAEAERERAMLVAEREKVRKELEKERRQRLRLPKDQAEQLKKREERKRRDLLRENVIKLAQAREKMLREREEAFERLRERQEKEVVPHQIERLRERLRMAEHTAHQVTREAKYKEEADAMKRELSEHRDEVEDLKKRAAESPDKPPDASERASEIAKTAERLAERYQEMADESGGSMKARAQRAADEMENLKEAALAQADGIDIDAMNDTSGAEAISDTPAIVDDGGVDPGATPAELYDAAVSLERDINRADEQTRAAERAVLQGQTLAEAQSSVGQSDPSRPDLTPTLERGEQSAGGGSGQGISTVGDFNEYRDALTKAATETSDMARRASRAAGDSSAPTPARGQAQGVSPAEAARLARLNQLSRTSGQRNRNQVIDLTSLQMANWQGGGEGSQSSQGLRADQSGRGGEMIGGSGRQKTLRLREQEVAANALPGRMLTDASARKGFLYLDTWYFVGPWRNFSKADFSDVHPPEQRIDLDAEYYDGWFADRPNHPQQVLRWEFVQSDRIAIQPPRIHHSSTFYAYTEVYSDTTREMLVAVASDDMAKVWLNGDVIWTDVGQSGWNLDEGFRKVIFQRGFNTVLVRIENGPAYCAFSVVLCSPEILEQP
ncbi:MAG: hypothetical protein AAGI68_12700 [Planctomycetota bacterium]